MGFPPFRGAVRQIIIASVAIYVVILLLEAFAPRYGDLVVAIGSLTGMVRLVWHDRTLGSHRDRPIVHWNWPGLSFQHDRLG
jgi:hypothetical protein